MSDTRRQLLRFLVVGCGAVAIDFAVYFSLLRLWPSLDTAAAKVVSFVAGAIASFLLNRSVVFQVAEGTARQIVLFALLYLVTLSANAMVNEAVLSLTAVPVLAWFVATGVSTVANFLGMKFVVFRRRSAQPWPQS
jgi:putative flippase GtrA